MSRTQALNLYAAYAENFPALHATLLTTAQGVRHTYGEAEQRSAQVAGFLLGLGLTAGDRVTVQVEKSPENLWLFLGVVRAGLIFHPLNTAYTEEELAFFLSDARPALVVCDGSNEEKLQRLCSAAGIANLHTLNADGTGTLCDAVLTCPETFETASTAPDDVAALVYSSGTTGRPKGIMLTHGNLYSNASVLVKLWGFTAEDCLLHALPVFHVHGLFVAIGCVLMSGASMRWLPRFEVAEVLRNLPHSTAMMGVPTYYTRLLAESGLTRELTAHMRLFISGSAPLLPETFNEFEARTGHRILERYGMTETGMNTSNPLQGERKVGTVGPALPGTEVRVCDSDGNTLPAGAVGDIQVKGPNVFCGYWNLPEKTAEDFTGDGFLITGDQGCIDEDGYVSIVGRAKDMVITGGLNVYPKEVELLIDELPGVLESAVIGLPDADFGEAVAAVVVPQAGSTVDEASIREAVKARAAGFKVPKRVFLVDELPRNTMGKVRKDLLRKQFGGESNAGQEPA
ncbi:MAG: malonyl-CoA synthase [Halioglobus sp.]